MTEEFIRSISGLKKICPHFHLSLQSGSDTVLSRMNRRYDTQTYRSVLSMFRRYFADFAVTTDIIVAFPAETQEEHEESLLFCREMGFSHIHVFPFSVRSKTKAAAMLPKVSAETAEQRRDEFLALSKELSDAYLLSYVGRTAEVLLETLDKNNSYTGYTRQYFKVHIDPQEDLSQGLEVKVHIYSLADGELLGRIISESKV
jgi:threonylcarbamoyladenosine tRNA methylthiotransferase MtaB